MSLNLIIGCMFSGKTSELLNRYERYNIANKKCLLIKFRGDDRYNKENVVTHSGKSIPSKSFNNLYEADSLVNDYEVICIDEVQFYPDAYIFCDKWANSGKIVEACGINGTFHKTPFPIISKLIPQASNITFLKAICRETGQDAIYSYRHCHSVGSNDVVIGGSDIYKSVDRVTYNNYKTLALDYQEKFKEFMEIYNKTNNLNLEIKVTDEQLINSPSFFDIVQTVNLE